VNRRRLSRYDIETFCLASLAIGGIAAIVLIQWRLG